MMTYDDMNVNTKDDVKVWKIEAKYPIKNCYIAGRVSGWQPEDSNADGVGVSLAIPRYGRTIGTVSPLKDQMIIRYQSGIGWIVNNAMTMKSDIFLDAYNKRVESKSFNVVGFIFALNVLF